MDDPSVSPPFGFGQNTYKDRGAIDRVDFDGPTGFLFAPVDNDAAGIDRNPAAFEVTVAVVGDQTYPEFIIHLQDEGARIADYTVTADTVRVTRDGRELTEGRDYTFNYQDNSDQIVLSSAGGAWAPGSTYVVYLGDGIRDLADNPVQPNHADDTTSFIIQLIGYDFGDAPMADTYLPNGARHIVNPDVHLGSRIDSEATPQVNTLATADAYDDGVNFLDGDEGDYVISRAGETKTIEVTASVAGVLDAWIDWDRSGVWDPGEKLAFRDADGNAVTVLQAGVNELVFDVPAGLADSGDFSTYARFRFSTTGKLSDGSPMLPTGEASDGEVEDYRITVIGTPTDWGDAPEPYPTLAADDGASHAISPDALYLGQTVTLDLEPHPNLTATGDKLGDDGFDFAAVSLVQGRDTEVSFQVVNDTGAPAYLNAWIDFNADGDWADAGERIAADLAVEPGENTLTISVPVNAAIGATFARFRLSTEQGLSFTGPASDGEVEDYQVTILPTPGQIQGTVWNDLDGNGIHGSAEPGLEGWEIYIDANGNEAWDDGERWTTSDANGAYVFDELSPGDYNIREVLTDGWQQTGTESYHVTVGPGEVLPTKDFLNQDIAPPEINSILRNDANPSNAAEVTYTVTFSEDVTGVDVSDFNPVIVNGDLTGWEISGIAGSGAEYTLTVTTGEGEGTLRVDLVNDLSIKDLSGHSLSHPAVGDTFHSQTYQIDRSSPKVLSIVRDGATLTNAATVSYTVTFSEDVAGVDASDFDLTIGGGLTGAAIETDVSGEGAVYTVTVTTGTGNGSLALKLVDDDSIHDIAGNALVGDGVDDGSLTGPAYDVDHTVPTVVSIFRAGADPTNVTNLVFIVTFSEDVQGVDKTDFTLASTLTGSSLDNDSVVGSGSTYTVTVRSGAGDTGTVGLNLSDNDSIHDLAGNKLGGDGADNGDRTGEFYTINRTSPTALLLSNDRVVEHLPINTVVGALSSTGPHSGAYTYALVSGEGDADNGSFRIIGDTLRTTAVFDYAGEERVQRPHPHHRFGRFHQGRGIHHLRGSASERTHRRQPGMEGRWRRRPGKRRAGRSRHDRDHLLFAHRSRRRRQRLHLWASRHRLGRALHAGQPPLRLEILPGVPLADRLHVHYGQFRRRRLGQRRRRLRGRTPARPPCSRSPRTPTTSTPGCSARRPPTTSPSPTAPPATTSAKPWRPTTRATSTWSAPSAARSTSIRAWASTSSPRPAAWTPSWPSTLPPVRSSGPAPSAAIATIPL